MNDGGDCRTAPATPGLSIMLNRKLFSVLDYMTDSKTKKEKNNVRI